MRWTPNPWTVPTVLIALLAVVLGGVACQPAPGADGTVVASPTTTAPPSPLSTRGSSLQVRPSSSPSSPRCVAHDSLPDRACTPGAVAVSDPSVLCARGYRTSRVRPPLAYTEALKRKQVAQYGYYAGRSLRGYEEDHLVPLLLGGDPTSPANLWPEAGPSPNPKDAVELAAKRAVCTLHTVTLAQAQAGFETDWRALGVRLGVPELHSN